MSTTWWLCCAKQCSANLIPGRRMSPQSALKQTPNWGASLDELATPVSAQAALRAFRGRVLYGSERYWSFDKGYKEPCS